MAMGASQGDSSATAWRTVISFLEDDVSALCRQETDACLMHCGASSKTSDASCAWCLQLGCEVTPNEAELLVRMDSARMVWPGLAWQGDIAMFGLVEPTSAVTIGSLKRVLIDTYGVRDFDRPDAGDVGATIGD